jgi:drug/metabolite transporter (DMT)-like permease
MLYLVTASFIWAFSFGLIKHKLVAPGLDPFLVAFVRLLLSLAVFMPFLRTKGLGRRTALGLVWVGAVQYGLMYVAYLYSYRFLAAHQVALFTIFTPVFVTMVHDLHCRKFQRVLFLTALLAVAGTAVIVYDSADIRGTLTGFVLLQAANLCFAFGQVRYRLLMGRTAGQRRLDGGRPAMPTVRKRDIEVFGLLYLGAALTAFLPVLVTRGWSSFEVSSGQVLTLLYLGVVPSGICFFMWNVGARRVGTGVLAVLNNAKVPLAVICSLVFFGESANLPRLITGVAVILASVLISQRYRVAEVAKTSDR